MPHFTASEKSAEVIASGEKIELDRTLTVLLVGVGGQGTILAGSLLAMAAADAGLDVKVSEIHGMSQRGGSVSTVVRMGSKVESMVAGQIAREVGSPRSTNVVLVGALSTALPFSVEDWEDAISRRVPLKTVEANLKAFRQGRVAAEA